MQMSHRGGGDPKGTIFDVLDGLVKVILKVIHRGKQGQVVTLRNLVWPRKQLSQHKRPARNKGNVLQW